MGSGTRISDSDWQLGSLELGCGYCDVGFGYNELQNFSVEL